MPKLSDGRICFRWIQTVSLTLFRDLTASTSFSAPFIVTSYASVSERRMIREAQYRQCLKDIESVYTRHKIACEASFRQCQRARQTPSGR
jgi:hypothetical protein